MSKTDTDYLVFDHREKVLNGNQAFDVDLTILKETASPLVISNLI